MARPTTKEELLAAARQEFVTLTEIVAAISEDAREVPGACEEWSVKDVLAHLAAWHEMLLAWEAEGSTGGRPAMPAPGHTWATTPALNDEIWRRHRDDSWEVVTERLAKTHAAVVEVIDRYDDEALFTKRRFAWTGSTSVGSYAVSATSSHYAWAGKLLRKYRRALGG